MHWITGTSSWVFRGIVEYMLGVRAEYDGLMIDPQLPDAWESAKATRNYRNAVYEIEIKRTGNKEIFVDGEKIDSNIVPAFADGKTHKIVANI